MIEGSTPLESPHPWRVRTLGGSARLESPHPWRVRSRGGCIQFPFATTNVYKRQQTYTSTYHTAISKFSLNICRMKTTHYFNPGTVYHVYNRTNGKVPLFLNESDYGIFLEQYNKYMTGVWTTHAYCLMPSHFHLLISVKPYTEILLDPSKKCTQAFSNFANSFAQRYNRKIKRHGSLFCQNFRRLPVSDEQYLKTVISYIHNNPVKDGLVSAPHLWKHSSYNEIALSRPTLFGEHSVIQLFGSQDEFRNFHSANIAPLDFRIAYKQAS